MTRRSFISDLLKCGIATTFLPGAGRIWKPTYQPIRFVVPEPKKLDLPAFFELCYKIKKGRSEFHQTTIIERFGFRSEYWERMDEIMKHPNFLKFGDA